MEDCDRSDGSQKTKSGLINSSSKKISTLIKPGQEFRGIFFCRNANRGGGELDLCRTKGFARVHFRCTKSRKYQYAFPTRRLPRLLHVV